LEHPLGKWQNLIPALVSNCYNDNQVFRLASIETLGFICEELTSKTIKSEEVDLILSALITNITGESCTNEEIAKNTLKAFLNCISLAKKNFNTKVNINFTTS